MSRNDRYKEIHTQIVEDGYKWVGYYYAMDGTCECGKFPIHHHFVLRNNEGREIVLGSTCIERHQNYTYLFKNEQAWENLKGRIKAVKNMQKLVRDSPEWKKEKWTLKRLEDMKRISQQKYQDEKVQRKMRTEQLLPEIEAYQWITQNTFIKSILEQAKKGYALSDRQVDAYFKIRNEFDEREGTNTEIVITDYKDWKSKPHFEDDFKHLVDYLRMWEGDRNKAYKLKLSTVFSDYEFDQASDLLYKYRKQLKENYERELAKLQDWGENPLSNAYIRAYERVKGGKIVD